MSDYNRYAKIRPMLAALLAGLSVPGSMNLLGTAAEPWKKLREEFNLFGYQDAGTIEKAIEKWEEQ